MLPEITPNYKPLPRLQLKDDPMEHMSSKMTEEEALNIMFQSKNNRYFAIISNHFEETGKFSVYSEVRLKDIFFYHNTPSSHIIVHYFILQYGQ